MKLDSLLETDIQIESLHIIVSTIAANHTHKATLEDIICNKYSIFVEAVI